VSCSAIFLSGLYVGLSFASDGQGTRYFVLRAPQTRRVVELTRGVLKAQAEQVAPDGPDVFARCCSDRAVRPLA